MILEDPKSAKIVHVKMKALKMISTAKSENRLLMLSWLSKIECMTLFWQRLNSVVVPRIEMAVRSITESSGPRPSSLVQNPDRRYFPENTENTPVMSASSWIDLNVDQDKNDETRNVENFEDGAFSAIRPNYDRRTHNHHSSLLHVKLFPL